MGQKKNMSIFHYIAGALSVFSVLISPVLTVSSLALFIIYEVNEDWWIKD